LIVLERLRRGIMVTDTTLEGPNSPRIICVNAAWLTRTGYGRDEIANQTPRLLRLTAEMGWPGRAWLQFAVQLSADGVIVRQTATFDPVGLWGLA
jgi:hypothetical protein